MKHPKYNCYITKVKKNKTNSKTEETTNKKQKIKNNLKGKKKRTRR